MTHRQLCCECMKLVCSISHLERNVSGSVSVLISFHLFSMSFKLHRDSDWKIEEEKKTEQMRRDKLISAFILHCFQINSKLLLTWERIIIELWSFPIKLESRKKLSLPCTRYPLKMHRILLAGTKLPAISWFLCNKTYIFHRNLDLWFQFNRFVWPVQCSYHTKLTGTTQLNL